MPLYTDPGSRTAHVWGHLSSYFRFKYFVSTEGKQLLQGTLKNMQGDHHTCTYLSKSISLAWKYVEISIKPLTSGLTPPTYTTPITTICLACEQALLFAFRLAALFWHCRLLHHRQPLNKTLMNLMHSNCFLRKQGSICAWWIAKMSNKVII